MTSYYLSAFLPCCSTVRASLVMAGQLEVTVCSQSSWQKIDFHITLTCKLYHFCLWDDVIKAGADEAWRSQNHICLLQYDLCIALNCVFHLVLLFSDVTQSQRKRFICCLDYCASTWSCWVWTGRLKTCLKFAMHTWCYMKKTSRKKLCFILSILLLL